MNKLALPPKVRIVEVGPRDGLQNEPDRISTDDKIAFVNLLTYAGFSDIEVTSFVRPSRIPQLADATKVFQGIHQVPGTRYSALVPNIRGLEDAFAAGVKTVAIFTGASETFTRRNINMSIDDSLTRFAVVARRAVDAGLNVRGYISVVFGCPYEGQVDAGRVVEITKQLMDMGCYEISFGDTIGVAVPTQIESVVTLLSDHIPLSRIALHLHDTRGGALANVMTGLICGVTTFDTSAGGLGGCPYAPGAAGNLATEDLLYMLDGMGIETGVDLSRVVEASRHISEVIGRPLPSKYLRAALARTNSVT
ncbi:MAG: hydroxymethylglutaryl-CoA lyase [Myxococcales bacterium]|nr:hydroxymethylglutaryl-CoA lyase [Myxococcales bacterium]